MSKSIRCTWQRCLLSLLLVAMCIPHSYAQNQGSDIRVTLNQINTPLKEIFSLISKQTKLRFLADLMRINQDERYTINVKDEPIENVLNLLFKNKGIVWSINKNIIVLNLRAEPSGHGSTTSSAAMVENDKTFNLTGTVMDEKSHPVIGATVLVSGKNIGATTDTEGKFTVSDLTTPGTLVISGIGFITQEIPFKSQTRIGEVKLKEYIGTLDETVVIAYGTTTKRLSTGNVSTVKAKDIEKQPVNNPLLALQGRVPGLVITQSTGYVGSGVTVRIQGQNSIANGNDPLYVIDGVPFASQMLPTINQIIGTSGSQSTQYPSTLVGNPLSYLNPNDIESIEVLKDADATAIYGSRAANGAILITTKRAKQGRMNLNINLQTGWGQVARRLDVLNNSQYLQMRHEALRNDGLTPNAGKDYDLFNNYGWDTTRNTNWQKVLIGNTAKTTNAQATISGGTDNVTMGLSATYKSETAVIPGDFANQKGALNLNIGAVSNDHRFRMSFSGNYMIDHNELPSIDLTALAVNLAPNAPALHSGKDSLNWAPNSTGTTTWGIQGNPLSNLQNRYKSNTNNIILNSVVEYFPIPGLNIKASIGLNDIRTDESQIYPLSQFAPEVRPTRTRSSVFGNNRLTSWVFEPQASYKKDIGELRLEILVGGTIQANNSNAQRLTATGYEDDNLMDDLSTSSQINLNYAIKSQYRYNAGFGRVNLNWRNKYILNITGRRDGTSRFGSDNLFHNFGSIGGAWVFTGEPVIKETMPFLSFGKLRGSYGTTGSDQINDYQYLDLYSRNFYALPYQGTVGILPSALPNPYLQWELTKKLQAGLDLGFFKERILLTINYFRNQSSNQLLDYSLPIIAGFGGVTSNFPAMVRNTGWEFSLNTENIRGQSFKWSSGFNITIPKNRLVGFPDLDNSSYSFSYQVGQPLNIAKAYRFAGVDPTLGTYQFYDSKGALTGSPDFFNDRTVIINLDPTFYGGFQNSFTYKGLSLDFLFQFVKQMGFNYNFARFPGVFEGTNGNQPVTVLDRWQKPGDIKPFQRYNSDVSLRDKIDAAAFSDAAYSDASFIRLKNISLSWQLPKDWLNKIGAKDIQVYMQGQNLLTFTRYEGMDPETKSSTTLPPLRMLTIGLRATL